MLYVVWILWVFFSLWGNKGRICGDLSLGYPLLAMPAPAASNLRPIQKHFSELEIQSMTFPNNALVTVGKIKWVQKKTKLKINEWKASSLLRFGDSTRAPRIPPRMWVPNARLCLCPASLLFITFAVESQPHSHFLSWLTDGKREHSLNTCWTKGEDRLTIRGW